jgi:probable phosphoglycerate mutase
MTAVYLVRHAAHRLVNQVLCGRLKGVGLDDVGHAQARRLASELRGEPIELVQSSPRLRAQQTARPIAQSLGLLVETAEAFDELDVGEWTGQSFRALSHDPRWRAWNARRANTRPPAGERMEELRDRVVGHLEALRRRAFGAVLIVSHAEPIRAALLHVRRMSFDRFAEIAVEPASVNILRLASGEATVTAPRQAVLS